MNDEHDFPATITAACERHYDDSGTVLHGEVAVDLGDRVQTIRVRLGEERAVIRRILFKAAGLPDDAQPEQLVGRHVRVALGTWVDRQGIARPVVRKWLPSKPATAPALKKPAAPAWENDQEQRRPPRTSAARVKASVERAGGGEDDDIPF
jgi:hypothetical protein